MEYLDFDTELQALNRAGKWPQAYVVCEVKQAYPDLRLVRDQWGQVLFCSRSANPSVQTLEIDDCHDLGGYPVAFRFYAVLDKRGTRIYSDPPSFILADHNPLGFGAVPRPGWDQTLEAHGLSAFAINKVRAHLHRHGPISYLEADSGDPEAGPGDGGVPGV